MANYWLKCLDEWLRVNATCPTCRLSIFANGSAPTDVQALDSTQAADIEQQPLNGGRQLRPLETDNIRLT
jgi:hypothetical protein